MWTEKAKFIRAPAAETTLRIQVWSLSGARRSNTGSRQILDLPLFFGVSFYGLPDTFEEPQDARHLQPVINLEATLGVTDDACALEHGEVLGYRGYIGPDHLCQFADASLALCELLNHEEARWMRQGFKHPGASSQPVVRFCVHNTQNQTLFGQIANKKIPYSGPEIPAVASVKVAQLRMDHAELNR
jgi:hypothetical protein